MDVDFPLGIFFGTERSKNVKCNESMQFNPILVPFKNLPLLNFEWVPERWFWRVDGVKGGRSPAQRTLDAGRTPIRCWKVECGMLSHST